jgi:adenylate cyclase
METAGGAPLEQQDIFLALERVLNSPDFDASERNRQFLKFIVGEALDGRSARIKAYTIATSVFGRHPTFDPQTDPIVRIEARRLRRSLERYYHMAGRDEPITISIPRGGYIPVFETKAPAATPAGAEPPASPHDAGSMNRHGPSIRVSAFEVEGDPMALAKDGGAFTRKLTVALARFNNIEVFGDAPACPYVPHASAGIAAAPADYILSGGIAFETTRFTADVLLFETCSGRCVWAEFYERPLKDRSPGELGDEVVNAIARMVAQPYGVIFSRHVPEALKKPLSAMTPYDAVLRFYQYWRIYDRNEHEIVRLGLERAIAAEPDYPEAHACLSMVLSDAFRFGYDQGRYSFDARTRALALAQRAIELAPGSSRAYQALSLARWFLKDVAASFTALEIGLALNPNDTDIMAELGFRSALIMNWEKAVPLLERSFLLNPLQPSTYRVALALYHYMHGRYEDALTEARRVEAPAVPYGHIMVAITAARLGRTVESDEALSRLFALDPDYAERVEADLTVRNVHPGAIASVMEGLRHAGLGGGHDDGRRRRRPTLLPRPERSERA